MEATIFERIGVNLSHERLADELALAEDLERLWAAGPDFVEVCPHGLGVILGGRIFEERAKPVEETLREAGHAYTVHAPHSLNLFDLDNLKAERAMLEAAVRFAGRIGAPVVVCHAGKRVAPRDARHLLDDQLAAERSALREAGDLADGLGVVLAVENSYPEPEIIRGTTYAPAAWPSRLAGQVAAVDHPSVGVCLDVGHGAVAASFFGFDFLRECAAAAPLVRHVHLHDNLARPDLSEYGEPRTAERLARGMGDLHLPPGRGTIPLSDLFGRVEFPHRPTCCVELYPGLRRLAPEAVEGARKLERTAAEERAVTAGNRRLGNGDSPAH